MDSVLQSLQSFHVEVTDYVATITMDVPPVNAQNIQFREELIKLFYALNDNDDVRCIVLTGKGKLFSAGADLRERPALSEAPGSYLDHNRRVSAGFDAVKDCSKPVIAAVNGGAFGAGCVLALCCDIIVASEDSYFAMTEVDVGLAGGVSYIRRHFGESDARKMIFTAERIYGQDLYRMNVVSDLLPSDQLMEAATALARSIARKSPLAVQAAKRSFGMTGEMSLREGYRYEQTQTVALSKTEDAKEAQAAFREKRAPKFNGK